MLTMAMNEVPRGPISDYVTDNIKRLRADRRWSLADLSDALTRVGRPMLTSGLHRIEQRRRRIDVDDLVAIAAAFDVSPITLLLPWSDDGTVALTAGKNVEALIGWEWLRAVRPLELPADQEDADFEELAFQRRSLPGEARPAGGLVTRSGRKWNPVNPDDEIGAQV